MIMLPVVRGFLVLIGVGLLGLSAVAWFVFAQLGIAGACTVLGVAAIWAGARNDNPSDGG